MKAIGVYCGSATGLTPDYLKAAEALGREIGKRKMTLIYGGGQSGLMGCLAETVLQSGGTVLGIIPRFIRDRVGRISGAEELVTESMHDRKRLILEHSDGVLALPGGIGTLDEFFEAFTWSQLGLIRKPVGLLNTCGFFDALLHFLDYQVSQEFLKKDHRDQLLVDGFPDRLVDSMISYRYKETDKWKKP